MVIKIEWKGGREREREDKDRGKEIEDERRICNKEGGDTAM